MHAYIQSITDLIVQHSAWTGLLVCLAAFSESLALVGIVLPGTAILIGVGAAAALGKVPLAPILGWATLGAIAGDGLSFWLGHRFRHRIAQTWPFSRRPDLLAKAETLVRRHGGTSVAIARFMPLSRALVPLVAGAFGMSPLRFYTANILSALAWAPAYILPGASLGALLGVLGQINEPLAVIVLGPILLLALAACPFRRSLVRATRTVATRAMTDWRRRRRRRCRQALHARSHRLVCTCRDVLGRPRIGPRRARASSFRSQEIDMSTYNHAAPNHAAPVSMPALPMWKAIVLVLLRAAGAVVLLVAAAVISLIALPMLLIAGTGRGSVGGDRASPESDGPVIDADYEVVEVHGGRRDGSERPSPGSI